MDTVAPPSMLPHLWKSVLASGILALVLGIMVIVWPGITLLVAAIFFGAYLLITGVVQVFFAFTITGSTAQRVLLFVSGAASLVLAIMCMVSIEDALTLLAIWIGIGFIFRGVATTMAAISDSTLPGRWWEVFVGVISLLAGVVLLAAPLESLETLTTVVGIWIIIVGVMEIVGALAIRKATKAAAV
ncbi:MAG: HdeD family acid-resistance protein [Mycobacterium sp.]